MNKKRLYLLMLLFFYSQKNYSQTTAPVLFISTGSISNITENNEYTAILNKWSNINLTVKPKSIVFISYSWYSNESFITSSPFPEAMHTFSNMPEEYYKIQNPITGNPDLAQKIIKSISTPKIFSENDRGIDSESLSILKLLFPNDTIPVCQFSINKQLSTYQHYQIAQSFRKLRDENILFICVGNVVYNPRYMHNNRNAASFTWAANFDEYTKNALNDNNIVNIVNYRANSPDAKQAVAYSQQFIPLIYAVGLKNKSESINYIYEGFQNASISLRSFMFK